MGELKNKIIIINPDDNITIEKKLNIFMIY